MTDETTSPQDGQQVAVRPERVPAKLEADERGILPIIPRDVEEAQRYANGLIAAGQVPTAFRVDGKASNDVNAPLVLMGVLKSMEIGLPPQTGLEVLLPLNGRFTVWGDGVMGLIQKSGKVKSYTERQIGPAFDFNSTPLGDWPDDFGFVVSIWRIGQDEPYVGRFTVGDAKRQNLWLNTYKKPWILSPLRMLKIRARSFAARDGFADCLMGLGIKEEVEDSMPDVPEDGGTLVRQLPSLADDEPVTAGADEAVPVDLGDANEIDAKADLGTDQEGGAQAPLI